MDDPRDLLGDVHHGLRQAKAKGDADAIAHIHALARESGAPPEDLSYITSKYTAIADALVEQGETRRRPRWRSRRRRTEDPPNLPPGPTPRQLPPPPDDDE